MSLRQLIQVQRHLMDASRNLAFTLWCSYSTDVNPNWNVQIHNCRAFLNDYDMFLEREINGILQFLMTAVQHLLVFHPFGSDWLAEVEQV